jgi:glyoxylase I family protein
VTVPSRTIGNHPARCSAGVGAGLKWPSRRRSYAPFVALFGGTRLGDGNGSALMAIAISGLTPLLEVFDLPASLAFYRDMLGFELVSGDDSWWCMLRLGEATLMLNTAYERHERPASADAMRVRAHADTSLYFSTPDPDAVHARLRAKGWPVTEPAVTTYGMRQVSSKDPDGFQLCFICPATPETKATP